MNFFHRKEHTPEDNTFTLFLQTLGSIAGWHKNSRKKFKIYLSKITYRIKVDKTLHLL
jgi:hypothetical protein